MRGKLRAITLIEVLTVIAIIGILAGIGAYGFSSLFAKSRDGTRKADLRRIQNALNQYYMDYRSYPLVAHIKLNDGTALVKTFAAMVQLGNRSDCLPSNSIVKPEARLNQYIDIPEDPKFKLPKRCDEINDQFGRYYLYFSFPIDKVPSYPADDFLLVSILENQKDPDNQSFNLGSIYSNYEFFYSRGYALTKVPN